MSFVKAVCDINEAYDITLLLKLVIVGTKIMYRYFIAKGQINQQFANKINKSVETHNEDETATARCTLSYSVNAIDSR